MRRLLALMKKADPPIVGIMEEIQARAKVIHLMPGEYINDEIEDWTWIFVEEGFLLAKGLKNNPVCRNFLWEGCSRFLVKRSEPGGIVANVYGIQAVEHSSIYYFSPEDSKYLEKACMWFFWAKKDLIGRSLVFHDKVLSILDVDPSLRMQAVQRFFRILLRVPANELAEFLKSEPMKGRKLYASILDKMEGKKKNHPSYDLDPL